jgi:hypothetical protein
METQGQRSVNILTLDAKGAVGRILQEMRHPRDLVWIGWRKPKVHELVLSRGDITPANSSQRGRTSLHHHIKPGIASLLACAR